EYSDPTGLYSLRARQYDPSLGRFDQTDSAPSALGQPYSAAYEYVADQPTTMVDPSGMTLIPAAAGVLAAAMTSSPDDSDFSLMSASGDDQRSLQGVSTCNTLGCKVLRDHNISIWSAER